MNIFQPKTAVIPAMPKRTVIRQNVVRLSVLCFMVSVGLQAGNAAAQSDDAGSFKVGESTVTPSIRLDYVTVDNTFKTVGNEVETSGVIVSPAVSWVAARRLLKLTAGYRGSFGVYNESILDFDEHTLGFQADVRPGTRHKVTSGLRIELKDDLDELDDRVESTIVRLSSGYTFGAQSAKGNIGAGFNYYSRTYNELDNFETDDDNTEIEPFVRFSYRVSPDTRLVTELRYGVLEYDESNRDRNELTFVTGLDLEASARTSGRVRLGVTQADFGLAGRSDTTAFVADVDVTFRPRSYSTINLSFTRDLSTIDNDVTGADDTIVDNFGLNWRHRWTSRFSTTASYNKERYERDCPSNNTEIDTLALEVGVNIRRWISVGVRGSNAQRTVADCSGVDNSGASDYDVNRVGLFLKGTL